MKLTMSDEEVKASRQVRNECIKSFVEAMKKHSQRRTEDIFVNWKERFESFDQPRKPASPPLQSRSLLCEQPRGDTTSDDIEMVDTTFIPHTSSDANPHQPFAQLERIEQSLFSSTSKPRRTDADDLPSPGDSAIGEADHERRGATPPEGTTVVSETRGKQASTSSPATLPATPARSDGLPDRVHISPASFVVTPIREPDTMEPSNCSTRRLAVALPSKRPTVADSIVTTSAPGYLTGEEADEAGRKRVKRRLVTTQSADDTLGSLEDLVKSHASILPLSRFISNDLAHTANGYFRLRDPSVPKLPITPAAPKRPLTTPPDPLPPPKTIKKQPQIDWRENEAIDNPRWYTKLCARPSVGTPPIRVLASLNLMRRRGLVKQLREAFILIDQKDLQGADLALSPSIAVAFCNLQDTERGSLLEEVRLTAQRYRRVLLVVEVLPFASKTCLFIQRKEDVSPLTPSTLEGITRLKRALEELSSIDTKMGEVEVLFAVNGGAELTQVLRHILEDEFEVLRRELGDTASIDVCEGRTWLDKDEVRASCPKWTDIRMKRRGYSLLNSALTPFPPTSS